MKHTPGPWRVSTVDEGRWIQVFGGKYEEDVAQAVGMDNARIIAAAPDLLNLVEHVLAISDDAYLTGHPEWVEIVEEARAIKVR